MLEKVYKSAVTGFIWTTFQKVGAQLVSLIVFVVLARVLSPNEFGIVALANATVAFLSLFGGAAVTSALVQRQQIDAEHFDTMFWTLIGMSIVLGGLTWVFAGWIAGFFDSPEIASVLRWLLLSLLINSLQQVPISLLRRQLKFRSLAIRTLISEPIAGAIAVAMALSGFGVWSLVARILLSSVIQASVLWYTVDWRPRVFFSLVRLKELVAFGIHVAGANVLDFAGRRLDVFLIGYILGSELLGLYTVAKRLVVLLVELIGGTVEHVFWPIFSRLQADVQALVSTFYSATQYVSLLAFPVFAGVAFLSEEIVIVVFGERWTSSAPVMQALAVAGLVQSILRFHEALMVGVGRPERKLRLQAVLSVSNLLVLFLAIDFGLRAITVGYAIAAYLLAPLWFLSLRSLVPVQPGPYLKTYVAPLVATAGMILVISLIPQYFDVSGKSLAALAAQVISGIVVYSSISAVFFHRLVLTYIARSWHRIRA